MQNKEYFLTKFYAEYEILIKNKSRSLLTLKTYKQVLNKLNNWKNYNDLLEQINEILTNNDSDNSNFTRRSIFKIFINWLSNINKNFIPFETKIKKFKWINGTRTAFSKNELSFILEEVKNYNNLKFESIF